MEILIFCLGAKWHKAHFRFSEKNVDFSMGQIQIGAIWPLIKISKFPWFTFLQNLS